MSDADSYTVSIKRRFWFFARVFRVIDHTYEEAAGTARFAITLPDGNVISFPRLDTMTVRVYPDYWNSQAQRRAANGAAGQSVAQV